jgi:hypothetical protein
MKGLKRTKMLDIEKCKRYFEIEDQAERYRLVFGQPKPKVKSQIREFLRTLGLIEYELVTTYGYECNNLHKGLN